MANNKNNGGETTETPAKNAAVSGFEKFFYRYLAWFPILVMPMLVVEVLRDGQYGFGAVVGLIHAVLVFRFVQVVNIASLFRRRTASDS